MTTTTNDSKWFAYRAPSQTAASRLFCLPYAGGGASAYATWPRQLADRSIEVCCIQLPGRENRLMEEPMRSIDELVDVLIPEMEPYLDLPYAVFGHSMGGLIGFCLVEALRRAGLRLPGRLFASAARPPQLPNPFSDIRELPDGEFIEMIGRRYGGLPKQVLEDKELLELATPILRGDFTLIETHQYQDCDPLPCPISVVAGAEDPSVDEGTLQEWGGLTSQDLELKVIPGDHFFLHSARAKLLAWVADRMRSR
tara:strand:- start:148 stop:909 length:762 start_codon:yes stop_codon:yes gene_type:complete